MIDPAVPKEWAEFSIEYRFGSASYAIQGCDPAGIRQEGAQASLDGRMLEGSTIPLLDDGRRHEVRVRPRTPSRQGLTRSRAVANGG